MTGIPRFEGYEEELREQFGEPGGTIFTVSGLTGVGTGTISEFLAEEFGLDHIDAGQFFREEAGDRGMTIDEFRASTEEIEDEEDVDFDLKWDRTALQYAFTRAEILLEGRMTGVLLQDIAQVRVWVRCDPGIVAERLRGRDIVAERIGEDASIEEIQEYVKRRNQEDLEIYREKYGVDPSEEKYYNLVIDNSRDLETVEEELIRRVSEIV